MKFLGIDLGWKSGASGLCCLEWRDGQLWLMDLQRQDAIADILAWVDDWAPDPQPALIAVDAPTLIPNPTGMRLCDRLTHRYFGKYDAGCYPANLSRPFAERTVQFGLSLTARGFNHAPSIEPQHPGRYQIEVFPHPATVHLFGLDRILKYKKGKLGDRRNELLKLRQHIVDTLPRLEPAVAFGTKDAGANGTVTEGRQVEKAAIAPKTSSDLTPSTIHDPRFTLFQPIPSNSSQLKTLEDQLDSLICAYVAAHWWYWGIARNQVLGNLSTGYIVVPAPPSHSAGEM